MPLISALQDIAAADAVGVGTFDLVGAAYSATLSGNLTVTVKHPMILKLDPGGASRDVTLEAEAGCPGRVRWIVAPNTFHHLHAGPAKERWPEFYTGS